MISRVSDVGKSESRRLIFTAVKPLEVLSHIENPLQQLLVLSSFLCTQLSNLELLRVHEARCQLTPSWDVPRNYRLYDVRNHAEHAMSLCK